MKTLFLITCILLSVLAFAQHDMKDMPGMKMSQKDPKKTAGKTQVKKQATKTQNKDATQK